MKKKYLTYNVVASYQPKDDTIHLTTKDADKNWHITLNKRTEAEESIRASMISAGLIESSLVGIPERVDYPVKNDLPWHVFPLGVTRGSQPVTWNVLDSPAALLAGPTGSGKSVLQRALFLHMAKHTNWRVVGIDLKRVELAAYRNMPVFDNRVRVHVDLAASVAALKELSAEVTRRFALMEVLGVNDFAHARGKNNKPLPPVMLVVDEVFALLSMEGARTEEGMQRDRLHAEALSALLSIARLGRAAGVFMVLATQRVDAAVLPGELRSYCVMRIAAGRLDVTPSTLLLDSDVAKSLPRIRGRGIVLDRGAFLGDYKETQFYWAGPDAFYANLPEGSPFFS